MPDYYRYRWMLKALYESAEELEHALLRVDARTAQRQPLPDEPSLLEIAYEIRETETVVSAHLDNMIFRHATRLARHEWEWIPPDHGNILIAYLVDEFRNRRHRLCSMLRDLPSEIWEQHANHPFRGTISVADFAKWLHQHDLDALAQAARVGSELATAP